MHEPKSNNQSIFMLSDLSMNINIVQRATSSELDVFIFGVTNVLNLDNTTRRRFLK